MPRKTGAAAIRVIEDSPSTEPQADAEPQATEPVKAGKGKKPCPKCGVIIGAAKTNHDCGWVKEPAAAKVGKKRRKAGNKPGVAKAPTAIYHRPASNSLLVLLTAAKGIGGIDAAIDTLKAIKAAM